jgi:hypothetical protein
VTKLIAGVSLMLVCLWGGTWLHELVKDSAYEFAAFVTAFGLFIAGSILVAVGVADLEYPQS